MKAKGIGIKGKGGAALVTAIIFVLFLTLFGLAFYRLGETDIDLFGYDTNLSKALYASEAGFDKVRWMIRESHQITGANPFKSTYVEPNALSIANPIGGDFFSGEMDKPYFKVSMIQDVSILDPAESKSKVRVRVLGSVDVDGDGEAGLTETQDVFTFDPDDVNRTFEAYVGLPGTLGERVGGKGISAAASAFFASGVEVPLSSHSRQFMTPDGDRIKDRDGNDRFLFFGSGPPLGVWDQWGFIFSDPAPTIASGEIGEIELPPGIFDTDGDYIDDDDDTIPDYFQDLDLRTYAGDKTFDSDPSNDPTAGAEGRRVIYVNGNITLDRVDFGHLNDLGDEIRNCNWECGQGGKKEVDLTFIANGNITVDRIDCGNVGRLVLVAKNITLVGDYDTKVNGIAIAFNDITLNGQYCADGILTHQTDFSRPVRYTAYFLGSMVAGNHIVLQDDGWTVIYDENVINGYMYSTTIAKPTLTYERAEAEDFNSSNNWRLTESPSPELAYTQGIYTDDEKTAMQGDSGDLGVDDLPELIRVYTDREGWRPDLPYWAIPETLRLDFTTGDFEDPDIPDSSPQNWNYHDTITFWMALDNFKRRSTDLTKITRREAEYVIRMRDGDGNTIPVSLDMLLYPENEWGTVRYHHIASATVPEEYTEEIRDLTDGEEANGETYSNWKRVRISLNNPSNRNFNFSTVERFDIRYSNLTVSWTVDPAKPDAKVAWDGASNAFKYTNEDGTSRNVNEKRQEGDLSDRAAASDNYFYLYNSDDDLSITWVQDPDSTEVRMREEVLMPTLRIDRLELPGKPASNNYLEYGLPHSLRLEITNWREL